MFITLNLAFLATVLGPLSSLVVVLFAVSLGVRVGKDGSTTTPALLLSIVGLVLLGVSGYLGGKLAYGYGIRVASEVDQASGYATRGGSIPASPQPLPPEPR